MKIHSIWAKRNEVFVEKDERSEQIALRGKRIKILSIMMLIIFTAFLVKKIAGENITSVDDFQKYIRNFGVAGPLVLTLFQAFQVIVPILPGYLGCAAGAIAFGSATGFWCNYIGISLGSIAAYFIAKRYGVDVVTAMFSEKQYRKWSEKISKKKYYEAFLFVAILLPLFPDDFLCYFSGLIKMNAKKFIWIIILGKPWCILAYSLAFGLVG